MSRDRPSARSPGGSANRFRRWRLGCAACLLALAGCGGPAEKGIVHDPLLGPVDGPATPAASTASGPGPQAPGALVNDLPNPNPPTTAALTGDLGVPVDAAPKLDISAGPATLRPPVPSPGPIQGVTLQAPIPAGDPRAANVTSGAFAPAAAPTRIDSVEQGYDWLERRGLKGMYRLIQEPGGYRFICLVPDKQNPTLNKRYENTTLAADGLSTVRAVIEKIEQDGR